MLRIEALLRRSQRDAIPPKQASQLIIDELQLNRIKQDVCFSGHDVELTPIQFKLLWVLLENHHEVMTKAFLYQSVLNRPFSEGNKISSKIRSKLSCSAANKPFWPSRHCVVVNPFSFSSLATWSLRVISSSIIKMRAADIVCTQVERLHAIDNCSYLQVGWGIASK